MNVFNVFTNGDGKFGNAVGIIVDTKNELSKDKRQQIAESSGFSEVVFINDLNKKNISIYSPQREIPFAGHALVGTAYCLRHVYNIQVSKLIGIGGVIKTWQEKGLTWIRGALAITPPWNFEQLQNPLAIEKLSKKQSSSKEHTLVWTWLDQNKGIIRARTFASDWGIPEDEANGSGSMKLASHLERKLTIQHGQGSIIHARPSAPDSAEVGGQVAYKVSH